MNTSTEFQGKPVCMDCVDQCPECRQTRTGTRRWTHGAAHWLPCPVHSTQVQEAVSSDRNAVADHLEILTNDRGNLEFQDDLDAGGERWPL